MYIPHECDETKNVSIYKSNLMKSSQWGERVKLAFCFKLYSCSHLRSIETKNLAESYRKYRYPYWY